MSKRKAEFCNIYTSDLCELVVIPNDLFNKAHANFTEVQTAVFITIFHFSNEHPESVALLTLDEFSDFLFISKVLVTQAIRYLKDANAIFEIIPARGSKTGKYMVNKCLEEWIVNKNGQSSANNKKSSSGAELKRKKGPKGETDQPLGN
ncbi:MAG: hypothetical protein Q8933_20205 [Bacteroidota bacterium]|nr:hypothetical protein [Bacteroidota bacterium]MDP4197563.1 hypothetical protein [Bacteroidota bacterium]